MVVVTGFLPSFSWSPNLIFHSTMAARVMKRFCWIVIPFTGFYLVFFAAMPDPVLLPVGSRSLLLGFTEFFLVAEPDFPLNYGCSCHETFLLDSDPFYWVLPSFFCSNARPGFVACWL